MFTRLNNYIFQISNTTPSSRSHSAPDFSTQQSKTHDDDEATKNAHLLRCSQKVAASILQQLVLHIANHLINLIGGVLLVRYDFIFVSLICLQVARTLGLEFSMLARRHFKTKPRK